MATTQVSVKYRPLRIGFLVRDGQIEDLVRAAGINTLLWGGIYNPLIPFAKGSIERIEKLLEGFNVDLLYSVVDTPEISEYLAGKEFLSESGLHDHHVLYSDFPNEKKRLAYLNALNIIDYHWEHTFKNKTEDYRSNSALVRWADNDPLKNVLALTFGFYPSDLDLMYNYETAFLNGLMSPETVIERDQAVTGSLASVTTPLSLTASLLHGYYYGYGHGESGLYVGESDSFESLIHFWNLRASGLNLQFLPKKELDRLREFLRTHVEWLDSLPRRNANLEDWIHFYHRNESREFLEEIKKEFPTKKRVGLAEAISPFTGDYTVEQAQLYFGHDTTLSTVEHRFGTHSVTVTLPEKKFFVEQEREHPAPKLVASIESSGKIEDMNLTLKLPYLRALNVEFGREVALDFMDLRLEQEGIGIIIDAADKTLYLRPMSYDSVVEKVLQNAGIVSVLSQSGLLTKRILEKVDGFWGASIFRLRGVRALFKRLNTNDTIDRGNATATIDDQNNLREFKSPLFHVLGLSQVEKNAIFDYLLEKEFFRAGLQLTCSSCKLENWVALGEIKEYWQCQYCGNRELMSLHLSTEGCWKFRRSGLFGKDNNQEGAVPVILTLHWLYDRGHFEHLIYTPALNLIVDSHKCEIDFFALKFTSLIGNKAEVVFGECKDEGGQIDANDVANLEIIREKLRATGLESYFVFSKTASQFSEEELNLFRELHKRKAPMILLTAKELEEIRYQPKKEEEEVPHKYASSLKELAENSAFKYLRT